MFETDDRARLSAARQIVNCHSQAEVERILASAEPNMAALIREVMARHGVPQPREPRRVGTLGRRTRKPRGI